MGKKDWLLNLKANLKVQRKKLDLSQQALAERSKLSMTTITRIEQGTIENLTLETIECIGKALKLKDPLILLKKK